MKKIFAFFISIILVFFTFSAAALASELEEPIQIEQTELVEAPQMPEDFTEENVNEYNQQVDEWNEYAKQENERLEQEFNQQKEEIDLHNQEEAQKVEENKNQLEKQEKLNERIKNDSAPQLDNYTDKEENLPDSWSGEDPETITIKVEKGEEDPSSADSSYKVVNIHVFLDEECESTYYGTTFSQNGFEIDDSVKNHLVWSEWETVSVEKNDIVELSSIGAIYGNGAYFRRCLEGYSNGYWIATHEIACNAIYNESDWDNGPIARVSYKDGYAHGATPQDIFSIFAYSFLRAYPEPEEVIEYTPNFLEYPNSPEYLALLEKIHFVNPAEGSAPTQEDEEKPNEEDPIVEENIKPILENDKPIDPNESPVSSNEEPIMINGIEILGNQETILNQNFYVQALPANTYPEIGNFPSNFDEEDEQKIVEQEIIENNVPLINNKKPIIKEWALVNLILMIITILTTLKVSKNSENEEIEKHTNLIQLLFSIVAIITFIFTEDIKLPMQLVDEYTIYMFILALLSIGSAIITKDTIEKEEEEDKQWKN